MKFTRTLTAALAAASLAIPAAFAAPAAAQDAPAPQPAAPAAPMAPEAPATAFSEEKLESFVTAALEVTEIQQSYQTPLEEAVTPEEQQTLIERANGEMAEAIESTPGITLDEYIEIGEAAQSDPELNTRLTALVSEIQAE